MQRNATKAGFAARTNATKGLHVKISSGFSVRINDNARGHEQRRRQERVKRREPKNGGTRADRAGQRL